MRREPPHAAAVEVRDPEVVRVREGDAVGVVPVELRQRRDQLRHLRIVTDQRDPFAVFDLLGEGAEQLRRGDLGSQLLQHAHLVLAQRPGEDLRRLHRAHERAGDELVDALAETRERPRRAPEPPAPLGSEGTGFVGLARRRIRGDAVTHEKDADHGIGSMTKSWMEGTSASTSTGRRE